MFQVLLLCETSCFAYQLQASALSRRWRETVAIWAVDRELKDGWAWKTRAGIPYRLCRTLEEVNLKLRPSFVATTVISVSLVIPGTRGSELTINVTKNASVTLVCFSNEGLKKCHCPSYPQNCHRCTNTTRPYIPFKYYSSENYFMLSGLEYSNSGLYVCSINYYSLGRRYRLNVLEGKSYITMLNGMFALSAQIVFCDNWVCKTEVVDHSEPSNW